MKRAGIMFKIMGFVMWMVLLLQTRSYAQVVESTLEDRVATSPIVFEGEVIFRQSFWNVTHDYIYTLQKIKINQVLKGSGVSSEVELITYGGTVYPDKIEVFPSLSLSVGEVGLFFVRKSQVKLDRITTNALPQYEGNFSSSSVVRYNLKESTASDEFVKYGDILSQFYPRLEALGLQLKPVRIKKYISKSIKARGVLAVSITNFNPGTTTAGTFSVLTINGSGFGNTRGTGSVAFSNADNGGASISVLPLSTGYVSWSDTKIEVEVPTRSGTGKFRVTNSTGEQKVSATSLTVRYNISNVNYNNRYRRTNLVNSDNSGGYLFVFQTDFNNNANAKNAYIRALDTWRCSGGTQVYFDDGGSTATDVAAKDGENVIRFDNGNELPNNVLGRSTSYWTGCNGGNDWFLSETDIVFDDGTNWNYDAASGSTAGNQIDFESVALHETGHSHQLGHVINTNDVMHYSIGAGTERRSLNTDDLDGGNDVINWSSGVCGKPAMNVYSCQAMALEEIALLLDVQDHRVLLHWDDYLSLPVRRFIVERSINRLDFQPIGNIENGDNGTYEFLDFHPVKGWYRIQAELENEERVYSNIVAYRKDAIVSGWKVYPVPFNQKVIIEGNISELYQVSIIDILGKEVFHHFIPETNFSKKNYILTIPNLTDGVYFLKLMDEKGFILQTKRLLKK